MVIGEFTIRIAFVSLNCLVVSVVVDFLARVHMIACLRICVGDVLITQLDATLVP